MNNFYRLLVLCLTLCTIHQQTQAQAPDFMWAKQLQGQTSDNLENGRSIAHDSQGNSYVTGFFTGEMTFGNIKIKSHGNYDIFVAKYDLSGNALWAQSAGGGDNDFGYGIAVDGAGNAYVTGSTAGDAKFGTTTSSGKVTQNTFVAKYSPTGNLLWVKRSRGTGSDRALGIAVDKDGNALIAGDFFGTSTFGNTTFTNSGESNGFVAKYDNLGNFMWAKQISGTGFSMSYSIAVDGSGNAYMTHNFNGAVTLGNNTYSSVGGTDILLVKYDVSGNIIWTNQTGGSSNEMALGVSVDGSGNAFVTGYFNGTTNLNGTTFTSVGSSDIFVAKYSSSGNQLWAKQTGGSGSDRGLSIATDRTGNAYLTGDFSGTATFGTSTLTSFGSTDAFVAKYDASGNVLWAKGGGSEQMDMGRGISVDNAGFSYVTGSFAGEANFGGVIRNSSGGADVYVAKYNAEGATHWAKNPTGLGTSDYGRKIAVDSQGNTYVTGYFSGTASFGNVSLSSAGNYDIYTAKYDASGKVLWAKSGGGPSNDYGYDVAVDGAGNVYVVGAFRETATFNSAANSISSAGNLDIFIVKYNPSGDVLWVKQTGGPNTDIGYSIAVDAAGNVYVTGEFTGTATFGTTSLTSEANRTDVFVAKYNSSGNVVWAKSAGGSSNDKGNGIAVDGSGNVIVTGDFLGTANFSNTSLTSAGGSDAFVAKYDGTGNLLWAKQGGSPSNDYGGDITVDASGNIYAVGTFMQAATFGNTTLAHNGRADVYITKYNPSGVLQWAKQAGGTGHEYGYGIALDGQNNLYITGYFEETAAFGNSVLTSAGGYDVFVAKYDVSGNPLWAQRAGGKAFEAGMGLAVSTAGQAHITGYFSGEAPFGTTGLATSGTEAFVAKLNSAANVAGIANPELSASLTVYPNPTSTKLQLSLPHSSGRVQELKLIDLKGQTILTQEYPRISGGFNHTLDLSRQAAGVYMLQIETDQGIIIKRVVKQ